MSDLPEAIYSCLLRLYPSRFRQAYGDEALRLFRDRARDERGFLPSLRLWFDLFSDLAVSLPREYRAAPVIAAVPANPFPTRVPSFLILEGGAPSPSSWFFAGALSLFLYASVVLLIDHGRSNIALRESSIPQRPKYALSPRPTSPPGEPSQSSSGASTASGESAALPGGTTAAKQQQFTQFDIATIRESNAGDSTSTNDSLGSSDTSVAAPGHLHMAHRSLLGYIAYAYKLNHYQIAALRRHAPGWVRLTKYDIDAQVQGNPGEDDMRTMMRALLADSFRLRMHIETHQLRIALKRSTRIHRIKRPVKIYVLDHVERPSEGQQKNDPSREKELKALN